MTDTSEVKARHRISLLLLVALTSIAGLILVGLILMTVRLLELRDELGSLRDEALPRLVKLSQLSRDAAATISIAPALSADPTRYEFETLLSRIKDKQASQEMLIDELQELIRDGNAIQVLQSNGEALISNLERLTDVVSDQIEVRKRMEARVEKFRALGRSISRMNQQHASTESGMSDPVPDLGHQYQARLFVVKALSMLFDPNGARFSRNKAELDEEYRYLSGALGLRSDSGEQQQEGPADPLRELNSFWSAQRGGIFDDKQAELANEFKIKALAEENSLIANRLLSGANTAFWRASADLDAQVGSFDATARFMLASMLVVVAAFSAGNFFVWFILRRRVFDRLDRIRNSLKAYADDRERMHADKRPDEIGAISASLGHYMDVIDQRETELADKTRTLEQLSNQLAKYLSPQVYDSIFSGRQEVKVASSRKKLTVFFSDIAGFTETADRLESEELSQLLNQYLTEMSRIALDCGATIDKYVGDAILIFFGDPQSQGTSQDALACVKMAIAMRQRMSELAEIWRRAGIERPLQVRMGIHTGYCTVGNFGSEDRMDYTIIGGAVNTASRLEELATPGEILVSYETFALIQDEIECEACGKVEVKGIAYPVATYRVIDTFDHGRRERRHFRETHPKIKLDLDLADMSLVEREQAASVLRRALQLISEDDDKWSGAKKSPRSRLASN